MDKELMDFEANFSVLDRYGTDITKEDYITNPAIGRDSQIKDLILILLTPEKSAILIGKPGIGKTAIVEGLAYRLQNDDVPDALKGYSIINIKTASLLGTMPSGESKVQKMIDELKTREKLILFIDEIHMLIGATDSSSLDFANIFKEGLGRGSIKVIGATTTEEYERYILRDKAFTRRFQKIEVPEPNHDETVQIMMGTLPKFEKQTGRKMKYTSFIQERIMNFLVDITSEYKRVFALGSRYPDVCLTLLKQAFSYTVYDNRPYMDIFDIRKAIENSKNIYPDVIKKELPRFDELFNDIILEEKGEKPIEEWRKDGIPTRKDIENGEKNDEDSESKETEDKKEVVAESAEELKKLSSVNSSIISKPTNNKRNRRNPIYTVPTDGGRMMDMGANNVPSGRKGKINRVGESKGIDEIILGADVETMKVQNKDRNRMPSNFVVNNGLMPGANDNYLLGGPIESTLNMKKQNVQQQAVVYRNGNARRNNQMPPQYQNQGYGPVPPQYQNQGYGPVPPQYQNQGYGPVPPQYQNQGYGPVPPQYQNQGYGPVPPQNYDPYGYPVDNRNRRPERMDISNQNFDKYNNYFHPDDNGRNMSRNKSYDNSIDVSKAIMKNNKNSKNSGINGMISLSDSDDAALFGYLNKNESDNSNSNNNNSYSFYSSSGSSNSNESSIQNNRSESNRDRERSNRDNKNHKNDQAPRQGVNIQALFDTDNRDESNKPEIDEFPMLNIMKGINSNDTNEVEEIGDNNPERKTEKNETKEKDVKQKENSEKKWNYLPNDDLLGEIGSLTDSDSSATDVKVESTKKVEEEPEKVQDENKKDKDLINFKDLNSISGDVSSNVFDNIDLSKTKIDLNLDNDKKVENTSANTEFDLNLESDKKVENTSANTEFDLNLESSNSKKDDINSTKPEYDLNLETGVVRDEMFDDFFD